MISLHLGLRNPFARSYRSHDIFYRHYNGRLSAEIQLSRNPDVVFDLGVELNLHCSSLLSLSAGIGGYIVYLSIFTQDHHHAW